MTKKDYSDPKTIQEIIDNVRDLQDSFDEHGNLDDLEEVIKILGEAIENTSEEDASQKKYLNERNRLVDRYPYVQSWLSEDRNPYIQSWLSEDGYDYQLDIKRQLATRDDSDAKTVQETIERCWGFQVDFDGYGNLDDLKKAVKILFDAIENTPEEDTIREIYINERNRLYDRYPYTQSWIYEAEYENQLEVNSQMTTKDYSDPETVEEIIEKCRTLQEEFNSEINLDYLEKALEILNKAMENTPEDDQNLEKYIYERNRLYNRYPDLDKWLSGPRYDYVLDIKYINKYENEEQEELNRFIIIRYLNQFNEKKERDIQEFFDAYDPLFEDPFDYAKVSFEGDSYEQLWRNTDHWQDWVSIFLSKCNYPKMLPSDEHFEIVNAPPLDGDNLVYLPVWPDLPIWKDFLSRWEDNSEKETKTIDKSFILPIYKKETIKDTDQPIALFEFSDQLLRNIIEVSKINNVKEVENLDIMSFHFIVNKIHISEELNSAYDGGAYWFKQWIFENSPRTVIEAKPKSEQTGINLDEFLSLEGNKSKKIFAEISISRERYVKSNEGSVEGGFAKLRLLFNFSDLFFEDDVPEYVLEEWDPSEDLFDYEYWEDNPNEYEIFSDLPLGDFLALFPGLPDNNKSNN